MTELHRGVTAEDLQSADVRAPPLSPWQTVGLSEGLAAVTLVSCCSMSFRWFSAGSTSLNTKIKKKREQINTILQYHFRITPGNFCLVLSQHPTSTIDA